MKLTFSERYVLQEVLPQQGSLAEQGLVKSICDKSAITDEEKAKFNVRQEGTTIKWDATQDNTAEICFDDAELALIKTAVLQLDKDKKVTQRNLSLCRKVLGI